MRTARGFLLGIGGSLLIALLISLVPVIHFAADAPVFAYRVPLTLEQKQLVDFLTSVPITARVKRVSWEENVLEIDLSVNRQQQLAPDDLYRTLHVLTSHALLGTNNVQELLVRVRWEQPDEPPMLLASFVARRSDLVKDPRMNNAQQLPLELYLSHLFKLTKTAWWYHYFTEGSR